MVPRYVVYNAIDGAVNITRVRIPRKFLVNLNQVNCKGTEETLGSCPHDDKICLSPGAAVQCPVTKSSQKPTIGMYM